MEKTKSSQYTGVRFDDKTGKYIATYNKKVIGRYDDEFTAAIKRDLAAIGDSANIQTNIDGIPTIAHMQNKSRGSQ